jgi:hypothetical protein
MKQLDELITKLDSLYIPIYVKGKEYPGNNPYILNKINNMLEAGRLKKKYGKLSESIETLEPEDLQFDDKRIQWHGENKEYFFYEELNNVSDDIYDEANKLSDENAARLAIEVKNENT